MWLKAINPSDQKILGFVVWSNLSAPLPSNMMPEEVESDRAEHRKLYEGADKILLNSMYQQHDKAESTAPKRRWYLSNLVVAKKAQGKGVGSDLLSWGLRKADEECLSVFCLSSEEVDYIP